MKLKVFSKKYLKSLKKIKINGIDEKIYLVNELLLYNRIKNIYKIDDSTFWNKEEKQYLLFELFNNEMECGNIQLDYTKIEKGRVPFIKQLSKISEIAACNSYYLIHKNKLKQIEINIKKVLNNLISKNNLVILVGGSGSGKTTTANYLVENFNYNHLVSYTTRLKRDFIEEPEYIFVDVEKFNSIPMANRIEVTKEWLYGVDLNNFTGKNLVYSVIDIQAAIDIKTYVNENFKDYKITIVKFEIDEETRNGHISIRENEETKKIRFEREKLLKKDKINYDLLVTDFDESLRKAKQIIKEL